MFKPKYRILITSKCFPEDGFIGLGTQLISIINSVEGYLSPYVWYACDVELLEGNIKKQGFANIQLSLVGDDLKFIQYCSEVEQFIWGVFLCVDKNSPSQNIAGLELETEDESFRPINSSGILMEIRAFDTTYFEIYTEDFDLISKISKIYNVLIEVRDCL